TRPATRERKRGRRSPRAGTAVDARVRFSRGRGPDTPSRHPVGNSTVAGSRKGLLVEDEGSAGRVSWTSLRIRGPADREAVIAALFDAGAQGVHEDGDAVITHFPEGTDLAAIVAAVR